MGASHYFLTIDAGTGSGRAVLFDTDGNQVAVGQEEWTHKSEPGVPNSMDFETAANWELICRCIKHAVTLSRIDPKDIKAVTATSMREGIVLYDGNKKELFAVANVDARADREVAELKQEFPSYEKEFYDLSGQTFALGALPRLLWVKKNKPEIYDHTRYINMISDWVLTRLSNEIATDPSNGGTTGVFSLAKRDWEPEMARKVGLKHDIFPPVMEPGSVLGTVTKEAADATGLSSDTLVVMGGGDVQLGSAGLGVVKKDDAAVLGGTFWQQIVNIDSTIGHPEMELRINPHVIPGLNQAEGITFFSGLVMRWFRDVFCEQEKQEAARRGIDPYALLEEMAKDVPVGSNGILPIFSDEMHYGRWYHAAPSLLNLSLDPALSSKAAIFRSLEENAAIVSAINLEKIAAFTGVESERLVFAGGASKGALWCQILADVTGKEIKVPKVTEATALGGAFACGVATGEYASLADAAANLVQWDRRYQPDFIHTTLYKEIKEKFQAAYKAQRDLVDNGVTDPMWKAPGL